MAKTRGFWIPYSNMNTFHHWENNIQPIFNEALTQDLKVVSQNAFQYTIEVINEVMTPTISP